MKLIVCITLIALLAAPGALPQSDEQLIETVRTSIKESYLQSLHIPASFENSGLSPSDKDRILQHLASDSADCLANTTVKYSMFYGVPISDMVSSDGAVHPRGESAADFPRMLNECIRLAWQAAGINTDGYFD